jgi:hypothetical protein
MRVRPENREAGIARDNTGAGLALWRPLLMRILWCEPSYVELAAGAREFLGDRGGSLPISRGR